MRETVDQGKASERSTGSVGVPRLRPGDRVRLVSPASTPTAEAVERGVEVLKQWGLRPELGEHVFDRHGYLAGTDLDRLADLHDAFGDPGIRAVFATRGGKGAYRITADLDLETIRADPKPLVGFSDITYLHLALQRAAIPVGFHGPATNWNDDYYNAECAEALRRALMETTPVIVHSDPTDYTARFTAGSAVSGVLVGGNLDAISRCVGWALPPLDQCILLLEDQHGTGLGQIDRCLAQLVGSGALDRLAGIALGTFGEFATATAGGWTLADVFIGWFERLGVPVLGGLPIGHGRNPATVPLGTLTTIDPTTGTMTSASGVR